MYRMCTMCLCGPNADPPFCGPVSPALGATGAGERFKVSKSVEGHVSVTSNNSYVVRPLVSANTPNFAVLVRLEPSPVVKGGRNLAVGVLLNSGRAAEC